MKIEGVTMATKAKRPSTVRYTLEFPAELFDHYAERAIKFGRNVDDEIVRRLEACKDHNAISGIYLDDEARAELTQITGKLVRNSADLLTWARQVSSLRVAEVAVPLGQTLTTRLA